jgi:hypothetical protein
MFFRHMKFFTLLPFLTSWTLAISLLPAVGQANLAIYTNTLAGSTLNVMNPIDPASPQQFWRAVWMP